MDDRQNTASCEPKKLLSYLTQAEAMLKLSDEKTMKLRAFTRAVFHARQPEASPTGVSPLTAARSELSHLSSNGSLSDAALPSSSSKRSSSSAMDTVSSDAATASTTLAASIGPTLACDH